MTCHYPHLHFTGKGESHKKKKNAPAVQNAVRGIDIGLTLRSGRAAILFSALKLAAVCARHLPAQGWILSNQMEKPTLLFSVFSWS